ncbi:hypothetical protein Ccrd_023064 [Cynara cardunculus var. scolymus]|uniref:Uncharacterized protein n=1 Tax=Cynara cardunculus var. scolymus TaxID=59895 RepID=A0A118JZ89_CYNCS|nr:hypothetical protein Ccrd_023064 [Cynara cardunculus var. scolymus]
MGDQQNDNQIASSSAAQAVDTYNTHATPVKINSTKPIYRNDGEVQTRKGLRWIPRHPETRKGVVSDEMLRGVENKHRSGDSRIEGLQKMLIVSEKIGYGER